MGNDVGSETLSASFLICKSKGSIIEDVIKWKKYLDSPVT